MYTLREKTDYGELVLEALKNKDVISEELYEKCGLKSYMESFASNMGKLFESYNHFKEINETVDDWYMGLVKSKYPGYTKEPFNFKNSMDVVEIDIDNNVDFINDYLDRLDDIKNLRTISDNDLNTLQWGFNRDYAMGLSLFSSKPFFDELKVPNSPESTVMKYMDFVQENFPEVFTPSFKNDILSSIEDCGKKTDKFNNSFLNMRDVINKEVDKRVKWLQNHPDEKYYIE